MKIICVGRNYAAHIEELANERPENPVLFIKPDTALLAKQHPFVIPDFTKEVHYEAELVVKINKVGKFISSKFAHKYYDQLSLGIDFTARDVQDTLKAKGLPWEKAKGFDGSALVGEFVSKDSLGDLDDLSFELYRNDVLVQKGSTTQMLWKIDELIAEISQYFTLKTGDMIFTGTPAGVGKIAVDDVLVGKLEGKTLFKVDIK